MKDPKAVNATEIIPAKPAAVTEAQAAEFDKQLRSGHQVDEELIEMIRRRAQTEKPHDGFVSAIHEHDQSLQTDRVVIYAWGVSASILAEQLQLNQKNKTRRL